MDEENKQYKEKMESNAERFSEAAKEKVKKETIKKIIATLGIKGIAILILVVVGISLLTTLFLAVAVYWNDLDSKIKAAAAKGTAIGEEALNKILLVDSNKYKISYDGKTGKEAIEKILKDNNMNFEDFTDEEIECLYKSLKAEWATTYPNLGDEVDNNDIDSEYVQGIITIKRGKDNGQILNLAYKPYDEFTNIRDENALKYFSIKDGNIIIANWSSYETIYTPSASMPEDRKSQYQNTGEQITITETAIDYKNMIGIHTIPFELLLSLLINTEDVEFVSELADLAFNSTIELTVYDNTTEIITEETEYTKEVTTYKKWANYYITTIERETKSDGTIDTNTRITERKERERVTPVTEKNQIEYELTTKRITKDNSYVVGLSNVSSWLADITNEYVYSTDSVTDNLELGDPNNYANELEEQEISVNDSDIVIFKRSKEGRSSTDTKEIEKICTVTKATKKGKLEGLNKLTKNTSQTNEYRYESGTKQTTNIGKKFKEVYDEHKKAQAQLDIVDSWLFEMLEESESTVDYVSVMKYLLYICTGENYGVTDENDIMELYLTNELIEYTDISDTIEGSSAEEKVWYSLKNLNFNDYAVAGVMGNIYGESGFNPSIVESNGEGIGLCQWSYGRKTQLINYANSKNTDWSDIDTQIEFLIAEITKGGQRGPAKDYATYQMGFTKTYSGTTYNYNTWKEANNVETATTAFCAVFERPGNPRVQRRIDAARGYYNRFAGRELNNNAGGTYSETANTFTYNNKNFTLYKQGGTNAGVKYPARGTNATLGRNGCGPTSICIVASGYGYSDTPKSLVSTGKCYSCQGDIEGYFRNKGFTVKTYHYRGNGATKADIIQWLSSGGKIIVRGADGSKIGSYYCNGYSHWVTYLGVDGNKIYVGDPITSGGGWFDWSNLNIVKGIYICVKK